MTKKWVELKRLFEPDTDDLLELQRYMHDPLTWRLYDTCGVHYVSIETGLDIFMLVEKDYPMTKGLSMLMLCMTRSYTNELFTPYKEPEREFQSSRRYFKSLSLDELRSPDFNLFSDQEYSKEEEAEAMAETMEQYMSKTGTDYES
ncbi:hypothetical protein Tco_0421077 [Tanacetum coccineum]